MGLWLCITTCSPAVADEVRLPDAAGELRGELRRGPDGRLHVVPHAVAPVGETAGKDSSRPLPAPGTSASAAWGARWALGQLRRIDGFDHDREAQRLQREIGDLVARERRRKGTGVAAIDSRGLSSAERKLIERLQARDREVRQHEARHYQAGRPHTAPPRFWTVTGPDGRSYAVSGQVKFDLGSLSDEPMLLQHQLTVLQRAALAPLRPSPHDLEVARALAQVRQGLRDRAALSN